MKIKIFKDSSFSSSMFEEAVNRFIRDKNVVDIKITSAATDNEWETTVMVIYNED